MKNERLQRLEPYELKDSRTVLRREKMSNHLDLVVKRIFGNENNPRILISFLNAVIKFLYYRNGIKILGDTIVLFKFDKQIIASAIVNYSKKEPEFRHGVEHKGALYIDTSTIETFKPISISKLLKEIPNLRYSTRITKIPIENLDIIIQLINKNIYKRGSIGKM